MGTVGSCLKEEFLSYDTPKIVQIKSKLIGVINRLVQITILFYIVVWVFIVNHGYQYVDMAAISGMTTKIKGVSYTNSTDPRVGTRIWDTADLIVPPQQNGGFFIPTNILVTHNQTQGVCAEQPYNKADCKNDSDCLPVGKPYHLGHGVSSGKCNQETGTCMVTTWCPIENDMLIDGERAVIEASKDFTIFIKSHVFFPHYKRMRSNLIEFIDKSYLRNCNYHPTREPYCPIFRVGDVVSLAENKPDRNVVTLNDSYFDQMALKGGVISITIKWDCNLDYSETDCKPNYDFERLDNYGGNTIAAGYNFRYPIYLSDEAGELSRDLVKAFGILFLVTTEAQARKFDTVTFFLNLGSGLALFGIASVCCDIFLLYFHRKKNYFKGHIFQNVNQSDQESTVGGIEESTNSIDDVSSHRLKDLPTCMSNGPILTADLLSTPSPTADKAVCPQSSASTESFITH